MRVITAVLILTTSLLLNACGQSGGLYLPQHSQAPAHASQTHDEGIR